MALEIQCVCAISENDAPGSTNWMRHSQKRCVNGASQSDPWSLRQEITRCVLKHKCPHMRQIPEVAIIIKTQGQDFKIYGSNTKVLSQVICIWNIKALSLTMLTIQNIWPMLKFLKSGSNLKVKVTWSKILVPLESSCHKEHTYEIWKPYHLPFKRYGQC
jgi:hypothetical protein